MVLFSIIKFFIFRVYLDQFGIEVVIFDTNQLLFFPSNKIKTESVFANVRNYYTYWLEHLTFKFKLQIILGVKRMPRSEGIYMRIGLVEIVRDFSLEIGLFFGALHGDIFDFNRIMNNFSTNRVKRKPKRKRKL